MSSVFDFHFKGVEFARLQPWENERIHYGNEQVREPLLLVNVEHGKVHVNFGPAIQT